MGMSWDESKDTNQARPNVPSKEKITSGDWNDMVADQKARGVDTVKTVSSNYSASAQEAVLADASGGSVSVTLPTPETALTVHVKKIDSSSNNVILETPNTETIDGDSTKELNSEYLSLEITSDGSDYYILY